MPWDETERDKRIEGMFRAKEIEEQERLRQAAAEEQAREQAREELRIRTGLPDPALQELESLGFTPETVSLLPLIPVLQVAWAEGKVTDAERAVLLDLARARDIEEGSAADRKLKEWLAHKPTEKVFASAGHLIAAMLSGPSAMNLSADEVVNYCEVIASASGGMLGIHPVSSEERALIASITSELKGRTTP